MDEQKMTFGRVIGSTRKEKQWSLKELALRIRREDGQTISPQYLNYIEHGRRQPSSDHMLQQFADALDISRDWLTAVPQEKRMRRT